MNGRDKAELAAAMEPYLKRWDAWKAAHDERWVLEQVRRDMLMFGTGIMRENLDGTIEHVPFQYDGPRWWETDK